MTNNKPTVVNYRDFVELESENNELKTVNDELKNEIIRQRIYIEQLESQLIELRDHGPTVTGLLDVVRNKMCGMCINVKECEKALDNLDDYPCPIDLL